MSTVFAQVYDESDGAQIAEVIDREEEMGDGERLPRAMSKAERNTLMRWYHAHGMGVGWLSAWFYLSKSSVRRILASPAPRAADRPGECGEGVAE